MCGDEATNDQLAQRIADLCTSKYEGIKVKSAKPTMRLNGVPEWTILAGLVAIEGEKLTLITLATGMKTMPNEIRNYSSGLIVHDLHAEILCLRMFNWCLMQEVRHLHEEMIGDGDGRKRKNSIDAESEKHKLKSCQVSGLNNPKNHITNEGKTNDTASKAQNLDMSEEINFESIGRNSIDQSIGIESIGGTGIGSRNSEVVTPDRKDDKFSLLTKKSDGGKFSLRPGVKLALYISEPPCGDASMSSLVEGEPWKKKNEDILRGRANFDTVGVVRTKPGRADSKVSYSKSCSDKLCLKQFTGVLNAINSLCIDPMYLLYLVVPQDRSLLSDFRRCFRDRLVAEENASHVHPLNFLLYRMDNFSYKKRNKESSPLPLCLVYCDLDKTGQVLQNGVKNGAHVKNRAPAIKGASILSRRNLWNQAKDVIGDFKDYISIKNENSTREASKKLIRSMMGLWPKSTNENFCLD